MILDVNSKIAMQMGNLMLTNIQLAHQLQQMQADAQAVADAKAKQDTAAPPSQQPSGTDKPIETAPANVEEMPAGMTSGGVAPAGAVDEQMP